MLLHADAHWGVNSVPAWQLSVPVAAPPDLPRHRMLVDIHVHVHLVLLVLPRLLFFCTVS